MSSKRTTRRPMYLVLRMESHLAWEDDMLGVAPIFRTKKAARKYAGSKAEIVPVVPRD